MVRGGQKLLGRWSFQTGHWYGAATEKMPVSSGASFAYTASSLSVRRNTRELVFEITVEGKEGHVSTGSQSELQASPRPRQEQGVRDERVKLGWLCVDARRGAMRDEMAQQHSAWPTEYSIAGPSEDIPGPSLYGLR